MLTDREQKNANETLHSREPRGQQAPIDAVLPEGRERGGHVSGD